MKKFIYLIALLSFSVYSQGKYLTKTGTVSFEASVPSFEEVKAKNDAVTAILNTDNGDFAALILVKGFRFKNALMEEHFNENYAESDEYPKATFKGNLNGFNVSSIDGNSTFKVSGSLTFHGKSKEISDINCNVVKTDKGLELTGNFSVTPSDFDIEIPKIVSKKIAEDIEVSFKFDVIKK